MTIDKDIFIESTSKDYGLPLDFVKSTYEECDCYEVFYQELEAKLLDNLIEEL